MKKIKIVFPVVLVLLLAGGYYVMQLFNGPLYEPGDLRTQEQYSALLSVVDKADRPNYFELNEGISLRYFSKGTGKPVLVVHGGPGIPYNKPWKGLDSLAKGHQFYYYDQRGCGESTRPFDRFQSSNFYKNMQLLNRQLGLPAQIADIEQIRRKLKQEKITLIGHSFGGFIAALYAMEFPERVEALVLVAPAGLITMPNPSSNLYEIVEKKLPASELEAYKAYIEKVLDFQNVFEHSEEELVALNKQFVRYFNMATKAEQSIEETSIRIGGWLQNAVFFSMGRTHDYSTQLQTIEVPTLVLHGEQDLIPKASVQVYLDHMKNSEFQTIPQAAHAPFNEQPNTFAQLVNAFFQKHNL